MLHQVLQEIKDASLSWGAHLRMMPELRYNYQQVRFDRSKADSILILTLFF